MKKTLADVSSKIMKKLLIIGALLGVAVININAQTNLAQTNLAQTIVATAQAKASISVSVAELQVAFWSQYTHPFQNPLSGQMRNGLTGTPILSMTNQISPVIVAITGNTNWTATISSSPADDQFTILSYTIQNYSKPPTGTNALAILQGEAAALSNGVAVLGN